MSLGLALAELVDDQHVGAVQPPRSSIDVSPSGMTSMKVRSWPWTAHHSTSANSSSSIRPFSATALIFTRSPASRAARQSGWTAPLLVATYISHSVARGLVNGRVAAAPFDNPMLQGTLAVDAAAAAMDGVATPGLTGPPIVVVTAGTAPAALNMSPADYFPALD